MKDYLQEYLSQVEESQILETEDKTELYILFVNCLEVILCFVHLAFFPRAHARGVIDQLG